MTDPTPIANVPEATELKPSLVPQPKQKIPKRVAISAAHAAGLTRCLQSINHQVALAAAAQDKAQALNAQAEVYANAVLMDAGESLAGWERWQIADDQGSTYIELIPKK